MNCEETAPLLNAYADGELDLVRSLDIQRHLESCAACGASEKSIHSLRSLFRRNDLAYDAPSALRKRVRAAIREQAAPNETPRVWPWQLIAFGATAFAILVLLLRPASFSEDQRIANEAIASHIRSLEPGHLTDVASTDQHTVKPWFNGKVDFAPEVKDFAAEGFPLVGGRLDYLEKQPVAALVYRRNKHLINVFIWPAKQPLAESTRTDRGFNVLNRDANGMHCVIVSDLNEKELNEFATLFDK